MYFKFKSKMMRSNTNKNITPIRETKFLNVQPNQKKSILPMHRKIYESSLLENKFIKKIEVPETHPSFVKDDGSNPKDNYFIYNESKTVVIKTTPMRKLQVMPMHKKLYESVTQKGKFINKIDIPSSHPSYNKKDYNYTTPNSQSFNKKLDLFKTTYDFLKPNQNQK